MQKKTQLYDLSIILGREIREETEFFLLRNWKYLDIGLVAFP